MYTRQTLLDCKQSMADRITNAVIPTSSITLTFWTRLLNRAVLYCADRLRVSKSDTLTTVSGTVALPDEFILMNKVYLGEVEQKKVDQDDIETHSGGVYWISGDQYNGFSLNTPTDGDFIVNYAYRPTPMVDDADKCLIPDIEAVSAYAYALVRKTQSDPFEDADKMMAECDARLKEMQSAQSINTDSINFSWE